MTDEVLKIFDQIVSEVKALTESLDSIDSIDTVTHHFVGDIKADDIQKLITALVSAKTSILFKRDRIKMGAKAVNEVLSECVQSIQTLLNALMNYFRMEDVVK